MKTIKVHFGAQRPPEIDYRMQANGSAEVWLYNDVHEEINTDGNSDFVADGIFLETSLTQEEVEAQRDFYFEPVEPETTMADLVEAINILTDIILEE